MSDKPSGDWQSACKSTLAAMLKCQETANPEDGPTMAYMSLTMVAGLRNETEEQALAWLKSNPKAEDHGGMWLVRV